MPTACVAYPFVLRSCGSSVKFCGTAWSLTLIHGTALGELSSFPGKGRRGCSTEGKPRLRTRVSNLATECGRAAGGGAAGRGGTRGHTKIHDWSRVRSHNRRRQKSPPTGTRTIPPPLSPSRLVLCDVVWGCLCVSAMRCDGVSCDLRAGRRLQRPMLYAMRPVWNDERDGEHTLKAWCRVNRIPCVKGNGGRTAVTARTHKSAPGPPSRLRTRGGGFGVGGLGSGGRGPWCE